MLVRAILILIPLLTFLLPQRWFSMYVMALCGMAAYELFMFVFLTEETQAAYESFGTLAVLGYMGANLMLLGVRYLLIRRARARILKLPAPK